MNLCAPSSACDRKKVRYSIQRTFVPFLSRTQSKADSKASLTLDGWKSPCTEGRVSSTSKLRRRGGGKEEGRRREGRGKEEGRRREGGGKEEGRKREGGGKEAEKRREVEERQRRGGRWKTKKEGGGERVSGLR